jgi:RimJ/RimL family protein N-acetyltransferase
MPPPLHAAAAHGISYRPMIADDLPFLAALYASARAEEVAVTGWPEEMQRSFLHQQFDAQHHHYQRHYPDAEWLVVEGGGEPIGRLYMEEWPSQIRIIDIALVPGARGKGTGAAILADVCALAASKAKKTSIHVEKNNPALRLYRRLGFIKVEDKGVYDLLERSPRHAADLPER